jgi:hypothetical protein
MERRSETLKKVFELLSRPLTGGRAIALADASAPRIRDPLWHVGHAAHDACRGLILPFEPDSGLGRRFADEFYGRNGSKPWASARPERDAVMAWWNEIVRESSRTFDSRPRDETLSAPVAFTAYSVGNVDEAFNYVIYHTSFHLGLARGMLGLV